MGRSPLPLGRSPSDFRSLRSKRKTRCSVIPALFCTVLAYCSALSSFLSCRPVCPALCPTPQSIMPLDLSCIALCPAMPNAMPFPLPHNFLPRPAMSLPCPPLPCAAPALPCPALLCPACLAHRASANTLTGWAIAHPVIGIFWILPTQ